MKYILSQQRILLCNIKRHNSHCRSSNYYNYFSRQWGGNWKKENLLQLHKDGTIPSVCFTLPFFLGRPHVDVCWRSLSAWSKQYCSLCIYIFISTSVFFSYPFTLFLVYKLNLVNFASIFISFSLGIFFCFKNTLYAYKNKSFDITYIWLVIVYIIHHNKQVTPGSLRLAAVYGAALAVTVILCGAPVGRWVDTNSRLRSMWYMMFLIYLLEGFKDFYIKHFYFT